MKTIENLSKYKDLEIEIKNSWGMKRATAPVIIGALELVEKGTENYNEVSITEKPRLSGLVGTGLNGPDNRESR